MDSSQIFSGIPGLAGLGALLPAGLSGASLAFILSATLVAGLARGFSGFGGALIFMPLVSTVIEPKLASAVLLIADGFTALGLLPRALLAGEKRIAIVMACGALIGVPVGTFILTHIDPVLLRWLISGIVGVQLLLILSGLRYRGKPNPVATLGVGLVSGVFSGAAQVGGPPVVAYLLGSNMAGLAVRANIILFFALSSMISGVAYGWNGLLTLEALGLALLTAPVFSLGLFIGSRLFGLADERTFRTVCHVLIATAALLGLPAFDGLLD